jgi:alpha-galactosidase/6-phospho-beta-glucosidase family protein
MKVVFVGGGSFRTLPIVRAAMNDRRVLRGGEIVLVDLDLARAETVGRLILKTPEFSRGNCRLEWTDRLDEALPSAHVVSVSFPVGSPAVTMRSDRASARHGFHSSDQLSVSGAFRAVTGGGVLLDIAQRMEKHCPKAWLADFANPVAVYSGMVNNHTRIRALGICGGFSNHRWDLTRLLGRDAYCDEYRVAVAGVNHLSFILRGTLRGRDLYELLARRLRRRDWRPPRITTYRHMEKHIRYGLERLAELHRRFGKIIFSTEGDGMLHLFFEQMMERGMRHYRPPTDARIRAAVRAGRQRRAELDREFRGFVSRELDPEFWAQDPLENPWFAANPADATVVILRALSGASRERLVASRPSYGAVKGFKDRTVLEYSMTLDRQGVHPDKDLEVPDCYHGLISALATHQTLLGDAVAARDARLFAEALFAYPIHQNTRRAKALFRELLAIHKDEMPREFQEARKYF